MATVRQGFGAKWILQGSFNAENRVDFVGTYGRHATFVQVHNSSANVGVVGELNDCPNMAFLLGPGDVQVFNAGDLDISSLRCRSTLGIAEVHVLASLASSEGTQTLHEGDEVTIRIKHRGR